MLQQGSEGKGPAKSLRTNRGDTPLALRSSIPFSVTDDISTGDEGYDDDEIIHEIRANMKSRSKFGHNEADISGKSIDHFENEGRKKMIPPKSGTASIIEEATSKEGAIRLSNRSNIEHVGSKEIIEEGGTADDDDDDDDDFPATNGYGIEVGKVPDDDDDDDDDDVYLRDVDDQGELATYADDDDFDESGHELSSEGAIKSIIAKLDDEQHPYSMNKNKTAPFQSALFKASTALRNVIPVKSDPGVIQNIDLTEIDDGDRNSSSVERKGKLFCDGHERESEVIYWMDVPGDDSYESPITPHHADHHDRYITFEYDNGGWNNVRMSLECIIVIAHAMGRTLVIPPQQHLYLLGKTHKDAHDKQV